MFGIIECEKCGVRYDEYSEVHHCDNIYNDNLNTRIKELEKIVEEQKRQLNKLGKEIGNLRRKNRKI